METKNLEWFLRRNFGLKGEYFSKEYKDAKAITDEEERDEAFGKILDDGFDKCFTKEAWDAWQKALNMLDDLVAMGLLNGGGIDSPYDTITCGFCDLSFE